MKRTLVLCLALFVPASASADPLCDLPVSAYLSDAAGLPLAGTIEVELNFYVSGADDSLPVDCRSFTDVEVESGWLRLLVDACADPAVGDCGVAPLVDLMASDAEGLWVGIRLGDDAAELDPRVRAGAVPYAVRASESDDTRALGGLGPAEFERSGIAAGLVGDHAANADSHHSSTSDGMEITPSAVHVGGVAVTTGGVDLGPDVDDELTAEIVRTLTGGADADALHTHASGHGETGGCYTGWGTTTCGDGFSLVYSGTAGFHAVWDSGVGASAASSTLCIATEGIGSYSTLHRWDFSQMVSIRDGIESILPSGTRLECALCCR
jgi:hypothetical protein